MASIPLLVGYFYKLMEVSALETIYTHVVAYIYTD